MHNRRMVLTSGVGTLAVTVWTGPWPGVWHWSVNQRLHDPVAASVGEWPHLCVGHGTEYAGYIALDVALQHAARVVEAADNLDRCIVVDRVNGRTVASDLTMEALAVYEGLTS